jgi:hypothetical protein
LHQQKFVSIANAFCFLYFHNCYNKRVVASIFIAALLHSFELVLVRIVLEALPYTQQSLCAGKGAVASQSFVCPFNYAAEFFMPTCHQRTRAWVSGDLMRIPNINK